ncbi:MAG: haloacid dehalogenase type II [Candidatus Zixiibacteriota bacterium]
MIAFNQVEALSFDCYGTLIDWEQGIIDVLRGLTERQSGEVSDDRILQAFAEAEARTEQEYPTAPYREILRITYHLIAPPLGLSPSDLDAKKFAGSVGRWPAFGDTREALSRLQSRFQLLVLSNVDYVSFAATQRQLGINFAAVITAEDVGAYKPDHRMFERLFETAGTLGIERPRLVHVAQSLYHDHVPAKQLGMQTVWVNRRLGKRGTGATRPPSTVVMPDLTVTSLAELADHIGL